MRDPNWKETLAEALADPSTKISVSTEGMSGSSTHGQIMSAAQQGLLEGASPTNWEMAQLLQAGRLSSVTFVDGAGTVLANHSCEHEIMTPEIVTFAGPFAIWAYHSGGSDNKVDGRDRAASRVDGLTLGRVVRE